MKLKNVALLDLDGAKLRQAVNSNMPVTDDSPVVTVARVLINAALTPANGAAYTPEQNIARYSAALNLNGIKEDEEFTLSTETLSFLLKDVHRLYAPIVAGQVASIIG